MDPLIELHLSIAARAYYVAMKALEVGANVADSIRSEQQFQATRLATHLALVDMECLATEINLTWQPVPVDRQLRTQAGILRDALHHASPETLRGFGALKPEATGYLAIWRRSAVETVVALAQAIEGDATEGTLPSDPSRTGNRAAADALNSYQRMALRGFAEAFASELLLVRAYTIAALPPGHPTITSPYSEQQIQGILAAVGALEMCVHALTSASVIAIPPSRAAAVIALHQMQQAKSCTDLAGQEANRLGDAHLRKLAELSIAAGRLQMLALNLTR